MFETVAEIMLHIVINSQVIYADTAESDAFPIYHENFKPWRKQLAENYWAYLNLANRQLRPFDEIRKILSITAALLKTVQIWPADWMPMGLVICQSLLNIILH